MFFFDRNTRNISTYDSEVEVAVVDLKHVEVMCEN